MNELRAMLLCGTTGSRRQARGALGQDARMLARCVRNHGSQLGQPERGNFWSAQSDFAAFVTPDRDYHVLGVGLFDSVLLALIRADDEKPAWLPVALFDIQVSTIPPDWEFVVRDPLAAAGATTSDAWQALWGYSELVRDTGHSDGLVERQPSALSIFRERWEQAAGGMPD